MSPFHQKAVCISSFALVAEKLRGRFVAQLQQIYPCLNLIPRLNVLPPATIHTYFSKELVVLSRYIFKDYEDFFHNASVAMPQYLLSLLNSLYLCVHYFNLSMAAKFRKLDMLCVCVSMLCAWLPLHVTAAYL